MRSTHILAAAIASAICLATAPAFAASDYLLEIGPIKGESAASPPATPIEVASWSWGASNPTSVGSGGGGAGKVNVQDLSVTKSAREAGSGMATGRSVVAADINGDGHADTVAAPRAGENAQLTLHVRESPTTASSAFVRACASGEHIPTVSLGGNGHTYQLGDVVVSSCAVHAGQREIHLSGHVTLMK